MRMTFVHIIVPISIHWHIYKHTFLRRIVYSLQRNIFKYSLNNLEKFEKLLEKYRKMAEGEPPRQPRNLQVSGIDEN